MLLYWDLWDTHCCDGNIPGYMSRVHGNRAAAQTGVT